MLQLILVMASSAVIRFTSSDNYRVSSTLLDSSLAKFTNSTIDRMCVDDDCKLYMFIKRTQDSTHVYMMRRW